MVLKKMLLSLAAVAASKNADALQLKDVSPILRGASGIIDNPLIRAEPLGLAVNREDLKLGNNDSASEKVDAIDLIGRIISPIGAANEKEDNLLSEVVANTQSEEEDVLSELADMDDLLSGTILPSEEAAVLPGEAAVSTVNNSTTADNGEEVRLSSTPKLSRSQAIQKEFDFIIENLSPNVNYYKKWDAKRVTKGLFRKNIKIDLNFVGYSKYNKLGKNPKFAVQFEEGSKWEEGTKQNVILLDGNTTFERFERNEEARRCFFKRMKRKFVGLFAGRKLIVKQPGKSDIAIRFGQRYNMDFFIDICNAMQAIATGKDEEKYMFEAIKSWKTSVENDLRRDERKNLKRRLLRGAIALIGEGIKAELVAAR